MAFKLNWDKVKKLHSDLEASGWKENDKLLVIVVDQNGKAKKATISFKELFKFCWELIDNESLRTLTFFIQDLEGKILYRHKQIIGNEEVPIGGNSEVITHWAALTPEEKDMYITILVSQIDANER